jgi:hypothetical protein
MLPNTSGCGGAAWRQVDNRVLEFGAWHERDLKSRQAVCGEKCFAYGWGECHAVRDFARFVGGAITCEENRMLKCGAMTVDSTSMVDAANVPAWRRTIPLADYEFGQPCHNSLLLAHYPISTRPLLANGDPVVGFILSAMSVPMQRTFGCPPRSPREERVAEPPPPASSPLCDFALNQFPGARPDPRPNLAKTGQNRPKVAMHLRPSHFSRPSHFALRTSKSSRAFAPLRLRVEAIPRRAPRTSAETRQIATKHDKRCQIMVHPRSSCLE